ncbi:MAG: polysaccharide biosynthesis/export family protein [Gammaproteobacteria bacterium]|nr:polysaccharide biosynthesis/export family protein [Gammaproteobacteria bacterium]
MRLMPPMRAAGMLLALILAGGAAAQDAPQPGATDEGYQIQPGDVLNISVWNEEDLQREVLVRPDGAISFPLTDGDIQAAGRTVEELRQEIMQRLSKYIPDLVATVSVTQILGNKIYVIGQVNTPGVFVMNPRVDVMQALSMAGGGTAFASLDNIRILRRTGDGEQKAYRFEYGDVIKGNNLEQNVMLRSGDVIVVP